VGEEDAPLSPPAEVGLAEDDSAGAEAPAGASAFAPSLAASAFSAGLPPPRKSVWYQPLPLSWKPAAETSLLRASLPQAGQVVRGASLNFCSVSSLWPHCVQRYS